MNSQKRKMMKYMEGFTSRDAADVVREIQQGRDLATQAVVMLGNGQPGRDVAFRSALVEAGLVETILNFLDHCAGQSFAETLPNGGDLAFPSVWVNALMNTVVTGNLPPKQLEETRVLIGQRLGPIATCMADPQRRFFQVDRTLWLGSVAFYAALLGNLAKSPSAVEVLMEHEAVVDFCVQALFWEQYRQGDIVKELKNMQRLGIVYPGSLNIIQTGTADALQEFCDVPRVGTISGQRPFTDEGMERLHRLANVRAVNSDYEGEATLASGLLEMLLREKDMTRNEARTSLLYVLGQLSCADCLSPNSDGAVAQLVEIGMATKTADVACAITTSLFTLLIPNATGGGMPDDERYAMAIEAGLFEMCLKMPDEYFQVNGGELDKWMTNILNGAGAVVVSRKSGKAIRLMEPAIREAAAIASRRGGAFAKKYAKLCLEIVDKAIGADRNTDDFSAVMCRWCQKRIPSSEKKRCAGCKRATYCSRECQVKDWKQGGHKQDCKVMATSDIQAAASGASKKEIKNFKRTEQNLSMAGNNLFSEEVDNIMYQASLRGYDITDCVTWFDFCYTPTRIRTILASDHLEEARVSTDPANYEHTKRVVARNKENGAVTVACIAPSIEGLAGPSQGSTSVLLKTFPSQAAFHMGSESWTAYQKTLAQERWGDSLDRIRSDPEILEQLLKKLTRE